MNKQITDTVDYTEVMFNGSSFYVQWHDNVLATFQSEEEAIKLYTAIIKRKGNVSVQTIMEQFKKEQEAKKVDPTPKELQVSFKRYVVKFYHSSDNPLNGERIVFDSDNKRSCMDELNRLAKYQESINQEMRKEFGADNLICGLSFFHCWIGDNGVMNSYGFRYWIDDLEAASKVRDLSATSEAMDYDPSNPVDTAIDALELMEEQLADIKVSLGYDLPNPEAISMGLKHYYDALHSLKQLRYRLKEYSRMYQAPVMEEPTLYHYLLKWISPSPIVSSMVITLVGDLYDTYSSNGDLAIQLHCTEAAKDDFLALLKTHSLEPFYCHVIG